MWITIVNEGSVLVIGMKPFNILIGAGVVVVNVEVNESKILESDRVHGARTEKDYG